MVGEDASRRARVTCFYLKDEEVAVLFAHAEDARLRNAAEAARKRLGPDWELRHKVAEMHSQEPSPEVQATRDKAWRMVARSQERELREIKARVTTWRLSSASWRWSRPRLACGP